jgi:hypothetical protein
MLLTRNGPIKVGVATVVEKDEFVFSRIRNGDLELLADNLPESVTQEDLNTAGSVAVLVESLKKPVEPVATPKTSKKKAV